MWIYRAKVLYLLGVEKQMVIFLKAKFMSYLLDLWIALCIEKGREWWVDLASGSGIMDLSTSVALFYPFGSMVGKILNDDKLKSKDATGAWLLAYWVSSWSLF